jgi:hypothetical protein
MATISLPSVQILNAGNYYLTATNGCGSTNSNTVTLTVNNPSITVSGLLSVCAGQSTTLTAAGVVNYSWNTGSNSPSITATPASNTNYTVTGADAQGCIDTETLTVVLNALPTVSVSTSNAIICTGETSTLTATGANTYSWNTTSSGSAIVVNPTTNTVYTVTGTDANGCSNSSTITQSVSLCTGITQLVNESSVSVFPNPFTDVITIKNTFENSIILIVDVLGKVVFEQQILSSETSIDLSELKTGFYQLMVKGESNSYTQKIIKQ